ncbi:MAG: 4-oxalocrotonate tautomerase [SAR202 cluster bacterium]|nr:4-oxalocrotonate tautomerase [SAR202 cluster bacterium]
MPVVTVDWIEGRSKEQKQQITKAITDALVNIGKARVEGVTIVFNDHSREHWASGGQLLADKK